MRLKFLGVFGKNREKHGRTMLLNNYRPHRDLLTELCSAKNKTLFNVAVKIWPRP